MALTWKWRRTQSRRAYITIYIRDDRRFVRNCTYKLWNSLDVDIRCALFSVLFFLKRNSTSQKEGAADVNINRVTRITKAFQFRILRCYSHVWHCPMKNWILKKSELKNFEKRLWKKMNLKRVNFKLIIPIAVMNLLWTFYGSHS